MDGFLNGARKLHSVAQWLMNNIELTVVGVNLKQFFMFKEGDTAYTFQWSSNYFGQYLVETEVKVGGLRRSIIIPKGKEKSGWKGFGIELTKLLEPKSTCFGRFTLGKSYCLEA